MDPSTVISSFCAPDHFNMMHFPPQDSNMLYTAHISYLEIYNEMGYDLLDPRHEASRLEDLPSVSFSFLLL